MITLYTTHCPRCNTIEKKLALKGIEYEEVSDPEVIEAKGVKSIPTLEVDGTMYPFKEANDFINRYRKEAE